MPFPTQWNAHPVEATGDGEPLLEQSPAQAEEQSFFPFDNQTHQQQALISVLGFRWDNASRVLRFRGVLLSIIQIRSSSSSCVAAAVPVPVHV